MDQPKVRKFKKKPVEIEAVPLHSVGDMDRALAWMQANGGNGIVNDIANPPYMLVYTIEGTMEAVQGSWLIRGVRGEFYACQGDIFRETYEQVDAA